MEALKQCFSDLYVHTHHLGILANTAPEATDEEKGQATWWSPPCWSSDHTEKQDCKCVAYML